MSENHEITLRQWQENWKAGLYAGTERQDMRQAGWYDWFCPDTELAQRLEKMAQVVAQIVDGGLIDLDSTYVWFKNNAPFIFDDTHDSFRITPMNEGSNLFDVSFPMPQPHPTSMTRSMFSASKIEELAKPWVSYGVADMRDGGYEEYSFHTADEVVAFLNGSPARTLPE